MLIYLAYFATGIAIDVIITKYSLSIVEKRAYIAGSLSVLITLVNVLVYEHIILSSGSFGLAVAFACGCGIGTYLTIKYT